jgi:hypothetical protein
MIQLRHWYYLFLLFLLWGCLPSGTTQLPDRRPAGTITGRGVAAPNINARVDIYSFENGVRGASLGSTRTDSSGNYSLDLRLPSQPVLVEISDGSYVEEASGTLVPLKAGQVLRYVGMYQSGKTQQFTVTPLTNMTAALADYKIKNGQSVEQAISESDATVNKFFGMDIGNANAIDITNANNTVSKLGPDVQHGFYLAGLSNWCNWASQQNQPGQEQATYSSVALSQVIYNDLSSDGLLNGIGINQDTHKLEPLGFGVVPLNQDAYRLAFSLYMLDIANSVKNKTTITGDDLLDSAHNIAAQTTGLVGTVDPVNIDEPPTLSLDIPGVAPYRGLFTFQANVNSVLGAQRITMTISQNGSNESVKEFVLDDPHTLPITIDTTVYPDGDHQVDLTAVDSLGNTASSSFTLQIDNSTPNITVTSPSVTNQSPATITGTYSGNVSDVQAIMVGNVQATLLAAGSWSASVAINQGQNNIPISVVDLGGNQILATATVVYLDTIAPVIDTTNGHSQARFSNGDGTYTVGTLNDTNNTTALYFETDKVQLGGVLIDRVSLDNNAIPYFAFAVSDLMAPGVNTNSQDIKVRMQYLRNDQVLNPWHDLVPVGGEYLIPLASETLSSNWHQSTPLDEHFIQIEVTDAAGNKTTREFSFRADFYVPTITIPGQDITDLGDNIFSSTDFANRANLNDMEFASTSYTFTNGTGGAVYLQASDNAIDTTTQVVDQLVRVHLVNPVTTPEWRLGLMTLTDTGQCPSFDVNTGTWEYPTMVYNWDGLNWIKEQIPTASIGDPIAIYSDTLPPAPAPSAWVDVPDFDQSFMTVNESGKAGATLSYSYDYILSRANGAPAGYVFNWVSTTRQDGSTVCPPARYFQQRENSSYESVTGYPKPVLSTITVAGTPSFSTTQYTVIDNQTGLAIVPTNGWYYVPADHSITIQKYVTTPTLTLYNDDISNVDSFASYDPNWYDKSISWSVDRTMSLTLVHDAGEANIPLMPKRTVPVGQGVKVYQISR